MKPAVSEHVPADDASPDLEQLTSEQQLRLTEVLDKYLCALEEGSRPSREQVLAAHPDLAHVLVIQFRCLEDLHGMAAGFAAAPDDQETEDDKAANGQRIGDFELLREIGRGGMGVVYEARQLSLDRRVALKLLPFAAVLDSKQIARFKHEAQAAAQVQHPNIVPVFAIGSDHGVHFYAMQLIDGRPLDQVIDELRSNRRGMKRSFRPTRPTSGSILTGSARGPEYFDAVVRLGIQAAEALHAAHEYGVVHRDIKPSNLLLGADGKLWVTDFGLARCQRDISLTRSGDVVGTLRYMSPEQAAGQSALVDHRTDVYSLGVTLYELVCLQPPFAEESGVALLRQLDRRDPPRPRHFRRGIPPDLETVILKAMAARRDDRYATAGDLADDLRRVLERKPTLARPPTLADRFAKWARVHRRIVGTAVAALLVAVVGLSVGTLLIAREKQRAERNLNQAKRYFHNAQDMLARFGVKLSERLSELPGAEPVRQELLRETLQYYHDFASDAQADASLRADLALTYSKVARLTDEIGSATQALGEHEHAVRLYDELSRAEPGNMAHARHLASCKNNLALAQARTGAVDESLKQIADAIRIQQQLTRGNRGDEQLVAELALSYSNQGLLQNDLGRLELAKDSYKLSIALLEELWEAQPENPERRRNLAAAYNNLAATRLEGEPAEAVKLHNEALGHQFAAAEAHPDDLPARRQIALTLNNLAAAFSRTGNQEEARRCYERAISIQTELVRLAPSQRAYASDLAVSHNNLGLIYQRAGRAEEAESAFRQALAAQELLVAQHPNDVATRSALGGMYNNLGIVLEGAGRWLDAANAFHKAIEHQSQAYHSAAEVARFRVFLGKHYYNYGRVLRQLGRVNEAMEAALARRNLFRSDGGSLYSVAQELAVDYVQIIKHAPADAAHDCARSVVETLEQTLAAGSELPVDFYRREPFSALNAEPEFSAFVAKLSKQ